MVAPKDWRGSREQASTRLSSRSERYVGRFYLGRPTYTLTPLMPTGKICNACGILHPGNGATCASCYRPRVRIETPASRERARFYRSTPWRQARLDALTRDNHQCQQCRSQTDLTVHHIIDRLAGGPPYQLNNLTTLCRRCHGRLHARKRQALTGGTRGQNE
jgi:hypothetical protein